MVQVTKEAVLATDWSLVAVGTILMVARINLRLRVTRESLILSDYFLIVACIMNFSQPCVDTILYQHRVLHKGVTVLFNTNQGSPVDTKIFIYSIIPWYISLYCSKASLLSFYFTVFPKAFPTLRLLLVILSGYCAAAFIISICFLFLICPWGCTWSPNNPCPSKCWNVNNVVTWALHFSSDLFIFILPLTVIGRMRLSLAHKASAMGTFGLGAVNLAVVITRIVIITKSYTAAFTLYQLMTNLDVYIGFLVATLPSLRLYLRRFKRKSSTSTPTAQGLSRPPASEAFGSGGSVESHQPVCDVLKITRQDAPLPRETL